MCWRGQPLRCCSGGQQVITLGKCIATWSPIKAQIRDTMNGNPHRTLIALGIGVALMNHTFPMRAPGTPHIARDIQGASVVRNNLIRILRKRLHRNSPMARPKKVINTGQIHIGMVAAAFRIA